MTDAVKSLADNRRARHDYFVEDTLECGVSLKGTEVKSMKSAHFSFNDAWVELNNGELWLRNVHINPYAQASQGMEHDPDRKKRLLAHREEIRKLRRKVEEKGFTLIPLKFYLKSGIIKAEIGL
ncbi:MAG: SsrA-binding protein SmpB [Spirochaetales bacterium]|nr:SsrA-binding protein SmpB [Spirochaetales bacterium]